MKPKGKRHGANTAQQEHTEPKDVLQLHSVISTYHEELMVQNEQLVQAQTELEQSRDRYARLYDEAPVGYLTLDPNGVIEETNLTALKLLGAGRETLVRRPLLVFVKQEDRPAFLNFMLKCRNEKGAQKPWIEVRLRRLDGGLAHVQITCVSAGRQSGRGTVFLAALTDVSGRIEMERERRAAEERILEVTRQRSLAQSANEAKDRFLAVLSHELRTPLTPAMARLSGLASDAGLHPELRDELKLILNDVQMESRLIDDLLDLSRIRRGKLELRLEQVNISDVLRRALQVCQTDIQGSDLTVVTAVSEAPLLVRADPARLQQVFWNIIRNAVKFTPRGGQITIEAGTCNGKARVRIADTGVGIEPELLPRIFDAFEQGGTAVTRRYGGLGLGLAICKAIVENHGGTLEVRSEGRDRGAVFTVSVPLQAGGGAGAGVAVAAERAKPAVQAQGPRTLPVRILLVEDHVVTRQAMVKLLGHLGYQVQAAGTAAEALAVAQREKFDVVVSDLGLPDRTGHELMSLLKQQYGLKGIALSGFGMEQDQARSLESGFATHLTKPVTIQVLQETIEGLVGAGG